VVVLSMLSIGGSIAPLVRKYELCDKEREAPTLSLPPAVADSSTQWRLSRQFFFNL
jgi:hypothetical protein